MNIWDIVFLIPFGIGIYIFIKTPISARYQTDSWMDTSAGFIFIFISTLYFYFAHISGQLVPEGNRSPCGRLSKQIECYNLTEETCMSAWTSSTGDCEDRLASIRKARPSFLTGNFLETCIGRNFDKSMHYNRKNEASPSCQVYFQKIDQSE